MTNTLKLKNFKRIVILACADSRKALIEWSYANKQALQRHIIISTARTAALLEGTLNTPVLNLDHGRAGGYQQVKKLIDDNQTDMILIFGNPMNHEIKEPWFIELIRTAVQKDIVVAYNQATIETVLTSISVNNSDDDTEQANAAMQAIRINTAHF